jgi:hypothetical protein
MGSLGDLGELQRITEQPFARHVLSRFSVATCPPESVRCSE